SLHAALAKDGDLLNADERGQIDATMANVAQVAALDDADTIKYAIEKLDEQTQDFAARRMDNSIRVAFKGLSIDNI
ncbi:MAG: Fe-S protein assembly chaperone HscA, partial [Shewanella sp.]